MITSIEITPMTTEWDASIATTSGGESYLLTYSDVEEVESLIKKLAQQQRGTDERSDTPR